LTRMFDMALNPVPPVAMNLKLFVTPIFSSRGALGTGQANYKESNKKV
jgi:hypothetical protein